MAIEKMPEFYKILVYTFNLPSCIASPFYEYKDFEDWIELKGRYQRIPNPLRDGVFRMITGFVWMGILYVLTEYIDPVNDIVTDEFCQSAWYFQLLQQFASIKGLKYAYYLVW